MTPPENRPAPPAAWRPLDPAAARFHETAIRCAKGIIKAWEDWYKTRRPQPQPESRHD